VNSIVGLVSFCLKNISCLNFFCPFEYVLYFCVMDFNVCCIIFYITLFLSFILFQELYFKILMGLCGWEYGYDLLTFGLLKDYFLPFEN
jgi:hypothetical protein